MRPNRPSARGASRTDRRAFQCIADRVGKRLLDNVVGMCRRLGRPVAERAAEAVRDQIAFAHAAQ